MKRTIRTWSDKSKDFKSNNRFRVSNIISELIQWIRVDGKNSFGSTHFTLSKEMLLGFLVFCIDKTLGMISKR